MDEHEIQVNSWSPDPLPCLWLTFFLQIHANAGKMKQLLKMSSLVVLPLILSLNEIGTVLPYAISQLYHSVWYSIDLYGFRQNCNVYQHVCRRVCKNQSYLKFGQIASEIREDFSIKLMNESWQFDLPKRRFSVRYKILSVALLSWKHLIDLYDCSNCRAFHSEDPWLTDVWSQ